MASSALMPNGSARLRDSDAEESHLEISIGDAIHDAARRWPARTALVAGEVRPAARTRWTYEELLRGAQERAWALLSLFNPGERVAIWAPNCPEWVFLEFGAALARITLVTVNPAYITSELAHVLRQSGAHGLILSAEYRGRDLLAIVDEVRDQLPELREVLSLSDWRHAVLGARPRPLPVVRPDDIAQIQYTSGTTGFPKGAELTHRGLANNGRLYANAIGAHENDVWINPMPMFHTAGCGLVTLGALQTGGTHVLPQAFDPALMLELFEAERGSILLSVPTMLFRMLEQASIEQRNLTSWRFATLGGAPVPPELVRRASEAFGVRVAIGFGLTEASPYITHTAPDDPHPEWWSTVGSPLPGIEIKIIDPDTMQPVPTNALGEVCTRSPCVMRGYFRDEAATKAAIDAEGWLRTGDLGSLDEHGYLRIQGRLKDMIIRGGENVYPREIEDVLFTHPAIAMAAVVGVPDPDWGEVVAACVQLREGHEVTSDELEVYARQRLAAYKVPRRWRFMSAFPQTASGKIQKFALRQQLQSKAL